MLFLFKLLCSCICISAFFGGSHRLWLELRSFCKFDAGSKDALLEMWMMLEIEQEATNHEMSDIWYRNLFASWVQLKDYRLILCVPFLQWVSEPTAFPERNDSSAFDSNIVKLTRIVFFWQTDPKTARHRHQCQHLLLPQKRTFENQLGGVQRPWKAKAYPQWLVRQIVQSEGMASQTLLTCLVTCSSYCFYSFFYVFLDNVVWLVVIYVEVVL